MRIIGNISLWAKISIIGQALQVTSSEACVESVYVHQTRMVHGLDIWVDAKWSV